VTRWGAVDLGSNTFRLLVVEETEPGKIRQVALTQRVVRLGQGVSASGSLHPDAVARAEACLSDFAREMRERGVERRVGALTAAGRIAADGPDFLGRASAILDAELFVPSGEEEAGFSYRGCRGLLPRYERPDVFFLDIGGGSTEAVLHPAGQHPLAMSLPAGVVRLAEEVRAADPPTDEDRARLELDAADAFAPLLHYIGLQGWQKRFAEGRAVFLATAGTPLTVASHLTGRSIRDTRSLNGVTVHTRDVRRIRAAWSAMSAEERAALPAVEKGREDVILAGIALLDTALSLVGADRFTVGDGGLLEGVLFQAVEKERGRALWES
jgi:exopolyphosphatase/guanosine-5'-triphosphate,3'-diphosphate pyrophosphatase